MFGGIRLDCDGDASAPVAGRARGRRADDTKIARSCSSRATRPASTRHAVEPASAPAARCGALRRGAGRLGRGEGAFVSSRSHEGARWARACPLKRPPSHRALVFAHHRLLDPEPALVLLRAAGRPRSGLRAVQTLPIRRRPGRANVQVQVLDQRSALGPARGGAVITFPVETVSDAGAARLEEIAACPFGLSAVTVGSRTAPTSLLRPAARGRATERGA